MGEQIDSSPDFLFRPLLGEKTMRGIVGEKTMRKHILTNEQNRSMNSKTHRVGAQEELRSTAGEARPTTAELQASTLEELRHSTLEELRLFTASEAARILHVSRNAIYAFWRDGQLDFWRINGTMTTNLTAIRDFLERTKGGVDKSVWE